MANQTQTAEQTQTVERGRAIAGLHEVSGVFSNTEQMQDAIERLTISGFDRADLSVPEVAAPVQRSTPESGAMEADTDEDARQARTLHSSTAAAAAALAGAGIMVATGGAAAPAIAVAVVAGVAAGGATYGVSSAVNGQEQAVLDARAGTGKLVLSVRAPTEAKRSTAEAVLRESGATKLQVS
jgi:hypothetical protein